MSITISNCDEICNSPTNQSQAKMLYTFSRQPRFNNPIKLTYNMTEHRSDQFYNLPNSNARSTSMGFGQKYDFTKCPARSPPPNTYQAKSDFDKDIKKGNGFGEGREQMIMTGPLMSTFKNKNPGPGNYELKSTLNQNGYSLFGRNSVDNKEKLKIPGPGSYDESFGLSPEGKYFLTKHKRSCVRNFGHPSRKSETIQNIVPGPGKYELKNQEMSPLGKYFVSKMQNSMVRRFGNSVRQPMASKNSTPGPGMYKLPSEFGHYLSKSSYNLEELSKNKLGKENKNS